MINFFRRLFSKRHALDIYMKSGNVIRIDRVKDYSFTTKLSGVSKLI